MAARRRIGTRGWGRGWRRGVGGRGGSVFWGALGHDKGQRTTRQYGYTPEVPLMAGMGRRLPAFAASSRHVSFSRMRKPPRTLWEVVYTLFVEDLEGVI